MPAPVTHFEPAHFINRELSWLEFNQRVLNEARDPGNPLLERLKFFCITASNLDEFFEVRVAGLKQQIESGVTARGLDGLTPAETLRAVQTRIRRMVRDQYICWRRELVPGPGPARHPLSSARPNWRGRICNGWRIFIAARCCPSSRPWPLIPNIPSPNCSTNPSTSSSRWK